MARYSNQGKSTDSKMYCRNQNCSHLVDEIGTGHNNNKKKLVLQKQKFLQKIGFVQKTMKTKMTKTFKKLILFHQSFRRTLLKLKKCWQKTRMLSTKARLEKHITARKLVVSSNLFLKCHYLTKFTK